MFDPSDNNNDRDERRPGRGPIVWIVIIILFVALFAVFGRNAWSGATKEVKLDEIMGDVAAGRVESLVISEETISAKLKPGAELKAAEKTAHVTKEMVPDLIKQAEKAKAENRIKDYDIKITPRWIAELIPWLIGTALIMAFIWFFLLRPMRQAGGGGVMAFGRSRAKLSDKERTGITFEDVAGIEEAKSECRETIEFLKNPKKFQRLGGRMPRGILLIGPPGTGKTLLAKAIAGEANCPFYSISGSDFVEMFVGVGASRVRDLFQRAKAHSPCIIFLDEIDAVGRRRGHGWGGGHDEREQTLNAILVEMDGFDTSANVVVLAATNRFDVLDPALLRPGRFDRQIVVDLPDVKGREQILRVHARKIKLSPAADLARLARGTPMFSGADLEAIINEAAILAVMKNREYVEQEDLEESRDKVRWGRQKTSRVMDESDKHVIAFHEAGHALIAKLLPEVEPLHRVTIIPRGQALGATMQLPEKDRYIMPRQNVLGMVKMLYAGRVSESMLCADISSGASDDIHRATDLINKMVREWGMSERIGPISFANSEEKLYGGEVIVSKSYSDQTAVEIDQEIARIARECYADAERLLTENKASLTRIAESLLKYEVLDASDVDDILAGREPAAALDRSKRPASPPSFPEKEAKPPEEPPKPVNKDLPGMN